MIGSKYSSEIIGSKYTIEKVGTRVGKVTGLDSDVIGIIKEYTVFLELPRFDELGFDKSGRVTNPKLREHYKEIFMSFYMGAAQKDWILYQAFRRTDAPVGPKMELLQNELRKIFNEIAQSGYKLCLDNVCVSGLRLTDLNFSNASMRLVKLSSSTLFKVNMSGADLTGSRFNDCFMLHLDLTKADLTGTDFETSKQADIHF